MKMRVILTTWRERLRIGLRSIKIVCYLCYFFIVFCYKNGCMWVGVQSGKFLKVKPVPGPSLFKMEVIPERLTLEKAREAREDHVKNGRPFINLIIFTGGQGFIASSVRSELVSVWLSEPPLVPGTATRTEKVFSNHL